MDEISRSAIEAAAERIQPYVRQTPVISVEIDNKTYELKLECLQLSGTFKARGAFNRLIKHKTRAQSGVAAASGGNHGIAVATAARSLGVTANIFVPSVSPAAKRARLTRLGADVTVSGEQYADAAAQCEAFIARTNALDCHAYDQVETLNGQGTLAREWLKQTQGLDTILVAVGGGGLIGGIAAWCQDDLKIVAVESVGCPTLHAALQAGSPTDIQVSGLAADSLGAKRSGSLMFPFARDFVNESVLVDDDAIRLAQKYAWFNFNLLLEPGGAVALAAILNRQYKPALDERVGILICGSNLRGPDDIEQSDTPI
ncbi:MAG: threonine/serine dehydratase [Burkholderiaceae bacterium]